MCLQKGESMMSDYREMYLIMMRAAEKAIRILIEAQQKCEELALADDNPLILFSDTSDEK